MASTCNPATGRRDEVVDLRLGQLLEIDACRSGVRTRPGIDMGRLEESSRSRLTKEGRIGPGGKPSSSKSPCQAVVGSRQ